MDDELIDPLWINEFIESAYLMSGDELIDPLWINEFIESAYLNMSLLF